MEQGYEDGMRKGGRRGEWVETEIRTDLLLDEVLARTRDLGASPVLAALATVASVVDRARHVAGTLGTASALPAEVGLAFGVLGAVLVVVGKTLGGALVVNADVRSATLVLVAVVTGRLDGLALAVGAEGAVSALVRLGALGSEGLRSVGDALLVDAVAGGATRVLVAVGAVLLDVLARATVAVRRALALSIAGAERVSLTGTLLRNTPASVTEASGAVGVSLASGTSGGRGVGRRRGGGGDGRSLGAVSTTRIVVESGGGALENLTIDEVSRDGLGHLESHEGGGDDEKGGTDGGTHFVG